MKDNIYIIYWRDASGIKDTEHNEWFDIDEIIIKAKYLYEEYASTAGWILYEDKNMIIIASTKSNDVYSDVTMIPKGMIFKIKLLKNRKDKT